MRALTDASLGQMVAPGGRSLGRIAWHIVQTLGEMGGHAGLKVEGANEKTPQPAHGGGDRRRLRGECRGRVAAP